MYFLAKDMLSSCGCPDLSECSLGSRATFLVFQQCSSNSDATQKQYKMNKNSILSIHYILAITMTTDMGRFFLHFQAQLNIFMFSFQKKNIMKRAYQHQKPAHSTRLKYADAVTMLGYSICGQKAQCCVEA